MLARRVAKQIIPVRGIKLRITLSLLSDIQQERREWSESFKMLEENTYLLRILCPTKI